MNPILGLISGSAQLSDDIKIKNLTKTYLYYLWNDPQKMFVKKVKKFKFIVKLRGKQCTICEN